MRHIFIINPASGNTNGKKELIKAIGELGDEVSYYETQYPGDGRRYVSDYCINCSEPVRFYACGGDGTIQEVAEGILGCKNAEMSCYPCGTGNDYVKYFGGADRFLDVGGLLSADAVPIDLIRMNDRVSVNIVNFGFDTYVAKTMARVKNKPLIGGKNSYKYGVFKALFRAVKNKAEIYADGERLDTDGVFMLCTVANGHYVGGQFCCSPRSVNDDGFWTYAL